MVSNPFIHMFFISYFVLSSFVCSIGIMLWMVSFLPLTGHSIIETAYQMANSGNLELMKYIEKNRKVLEDQLLDRVEIEQLLEQYLINQDAESPNVMCNSCKKNISKNEPYFHTPMCSHRFHKGCLLQRAITHSSCPVCKRSIRIGLLNENYRDLLNHSLMSDPNEDEDRNRALSDPLLEQGVLDLPANRQRRNKTLLWLGRKESLNKILKKAPFEH